MIVTDGGGEGVPPRMSADEWIVNQLAELERGRDTRVEVVTADKWLRREVQGIRVNTINPVRFWRRYLPRLRGLKSDYSNEPKDGSA